MNKALDAQLTYVNLTRLTSDVKAQWICLCLPSCDPGFDYQAHHLNLNCDEKRTKINQVRGWDWLIYKNLGRHHKLQKRLLNKMC